MFLKQTFYKHIPMSILELYCMFDQLMLISCTFKNC